MNPHIRHPGGHAGLEPHANVIHERSPAPGVDPQRSPHPGVDPEDAAAANPDAPWRVARAAFRRRGLASDKPMLSAAQARQVVESRRH